MLHGDFEVMQSTELMTVALFGGLIFPSKRIRRMAACGVKVDDEMELISAPFQVTRLMLLFAWQVEPVRRSSWLESGKQSA